MKKEPKGEKLIPQHKRMAEGEHVTGMKKGGCLKTGGKVEKPKKKK